MSGTRLTNQNLISEILPVVKDAMSKWKRGEIKLDSEDHYGRKQHLEWVGDFIRLVWSEHKGSEIVISVAREIERGRYDYAIIAAKLNNNDVKFWYEKTIRGKGSGFYANLTDTGTFTGVTRGEN